MTEIEKYRVQVINLCSKHKVKRLYVFGSAAEDRLTPGSDIDFLVDFDEMDTILYADNYFDFKFSLEKIFNRPIDLLEEKALKNPYMIQAINQERQLVYGH